MKKTTQIALAATAIAAFLVLVAPWRQWVSAPELPVLGQVPAFQLVSDDGRPFETSALKGRPWLASFLYTTCPGPCPRLVERLKKLRRKVPPASLAFVSISVDPATDTPPVLQKFKSDHGIGSGDAWTFLTGPPTDVIALVQRGFLTGVERGSGSPEEGAVSHGTRVALIDANGGIRAFYSSESDEELARVIDDLGSVGAPR